MQKTVDKAPTIRYAKDGNGQEIKHYGPSRKAIRGEGQFKHPHRILLDGRADHATKPSPVKTKNKSRAANKVVKAKRKENR